MTWNLAERFYHWAQQRFKHTEADTVSFTIGCGDALLCVDAADVELTVQSPTHVGTGWSPMDADHAVYVDATDVKIIPPGGTDPVDIADLT